MVALVDRRAFVDMLLYPIIIAIDAVTPNVGFFWDETSSLRCARVRPSVDDSVIAYEGLRTCDDDPASSLMPRV